MPWPLQGGDDVAGHSDSTPVVCHVMGMWMQQMKDMLLCCYLLTNSTNAAVLDHEYTTLTHDDEGGLTSAGGEGGSMPTGAARFSSLFVSFKVGPRRG